MYLCVYVYIYIHSIFRMCMSANVCTELRKSRASGIQDQWCNGKDALDFKAEAEDGCRNIGLRV